MRKLKKKKTTATRSSSRIKPRPPLRAAQLWKLAQKQLNAFQDSVWASMDSYSKKLGWGLTGIQPECWTLLDSAVDELAALRDCYRLTWEQNMGGGRGLQMEVRGDQESVYLVWAKLHWDQAKGVRVVHDRQEQTLVRDIHVYWRGSEFDPHKSWPRVPRIQG